MWVIRDMPAIRWFESISPNCFEQVRMNHLIEIVRHEIREFKESIEHELSHLLDIEQVDVWSNGRFCDRHLISLLRASRCLECVPASTRWLVVLFQQRHFAPVTGWPETRANRLA